MNRRDLRKLRKCDFFELVNCFEFSNIVLEIAVLDLKSIFSPVCDNCDYKKK